MQQPSYINLQDGGRLAYRFTPGKAPAVMFLSGFKSNMQGSKATALEEHCREIGQAFVRFDYSGHGESRGNFEDGTIGRWFADALTVLETVIDGKCVLVGSSMGGWMALLLARARPKLVKGLVGIAAAPDFTEKLMWQGFDEKQKKQMETEGKIDIPDCYGGDAYPITQALIEEGRHHQLLDAPIPIHCPVRLLHGQQDEDVPWRFALDIAEKVESGDVEVTLVKRGTHRMSEPEDIARLCRTVDNVLEIVKNDAKNTKEPLPKRCSDGK